MQPDMDPDRIARQRARQQRAEQIQRRRMALGVVVLAIVVIIVILVLALSGGDDSTATQSTESTDSSSGSLPSATYAATLTGDQSVPPVTTKAAATLILTYDGEKQQMEFVLEVTSAITNPSTATIYQGTPGTSGTAVYNLFAGPTEEGLFSGVLADGVILDEDLIGPLRGLTVADLIQMIEAGNMYVSLGNTSHPVDAIRGQIE